MKTSVRQWIVDKRDFIKKKIKYTTIYSKIPGHLFLYITSFFSFQKTGWKTKIRNSFHPFFLDFVQKSNIADFCLVIVLLPQIHLFSINTCKEQRFLANELNKSAVLKILKYFELNFNTFLS